MDSFIKYCKVLEPIVKRTRDSLHSATVTFLREQRATFFSLWERDIFKIISARRGEDGKYCREDSIGENDDQNTKHFKRKRQGFDFALLLDDVCDEYPCDEDGLC